MKKIAGGIADRMWKTLFMGCWLGALGLTDARYKRVPVIFLAAGGIVTIVSLFAGWVVNAGVEESMWSLAPGILLLIVSALTGSAGWADGVTLLILGGAAGARACFLSFVLSMVFIAVVSLILLALRRVQKNTKMPYLPFLWAGFLVQAVFIKAG